MIVVGADDERPAALRPIELGGLRERVEQIARDRIDPPVRARIIEIPAADLPGSGYLVIEIPPSSEGPHAVDGVFRGRAGSINVRLSAAEVRRLHEQRPDEGLPDIRAALDAFISLDPTPANQRRQAHLFVLARPAYSDPEMLQDAVGADWERWTRINVLEAPRLDQGFSPDFREAYRLARAPGGWIATTFEAAHLPPEPLRESDGLEVEIGEDGSIRLFCSRASDFWKGARVVFETLVGGLVLRTVMLASAVSEAAGFTGHWEIGAGLTNLRGTVSYFRLRHWFVDVEDCPPYPSDGYERTWRGTSADLRVADVVLARLIGPLNRTFNDGRCILPRPPI